MRPHPQELADNLNREVPRLVRRLESQFGFKLVDAFKRRTVPEFRRLLAHLVRELDAIHWDRARIVEALDTTPEAVDAALAAPKVTTP